jgi:flagellar biosynthesis/type III secretory pathway protein FliH
MGGRDVQFTADDGIARGGCIVRTTRTEVDATLDAQIAEIVSVLLGGGPAAPAKESTAA